MKGYFNINLTQSKFQKKQLYNLNFQVKNYKYSKHFFINIKN